MTTKISLLLAAIFGYAAPLLAQPQVCLLDDGHIGGYYGFNWGPFAFGNCMVHVGTDTSVWKVWPGSVNQEWSDICPTFQIPSVAMLETVMPYSIVAQDTFTIKHVCNVFHTEGLAVRLAEANANELAGLPDQILDGTEKWLLTVMYYDLCHDLDTLDDHVTTRLSVDRGATWIDAADPLSPFQTGATPPVCSGWSSWELDQSVVAPPLWTGNGYAWRSRHVFDLFQGYRALWPLYTDPADYLAAWNVNAVDTVIQQFVLHSDGLHSGKRGWRLPGMFVTSFHVRESGLGVGFVPSLEEVPEVRYDPMPGLHAPIGGEIGYFRVYDATGKEVQQGVLEPAQAVPLVPGASSGYYIARTATPDGRQWSATFINP